MFNVWMQPSLQHTKQLVVHRWSMPLLCGARILQISIKLLESLQNRVARWICGCHWSPPTNSWTIPSSDCCSQLSGVARSPRMGGHVLYHMRILYRTRMVHTMHTRTVRFSVPYAYGIDIRVWYVPYAYYAVSSSLAIT